MIPLYHESHFTFRFGDDRIIPRFHLKELKPDAEYPCSRSRQKPASSWGY